MFKNDVIFCKESWHVEWEWHPRDWRKFGWQTMRHDAVVYKALNIGPVSIYSDWTPIESKEQSDE